MTDTIKIEYTGQKNPFWYIRLGALLQYLQDNLMYLATTENNASIVSLLKFDTEVESNLMFVEDLQVSTDPNICLINRTINIEGNNCTFTTQNNQQAEPFESPLFKGYRCYGQIMNIYVHMKWVLIKLDELKDANTNKVVLIDFLNNILSSINTALGGVNALEATIDENINTIIIRDKNPLPNVEDIVIPTLNEYYKNQNINKQIPNEFVTFDLYGYSTKEPELYNKAGHASFIKDFSFTTEITPQLSTILTVGATANSTVVGENSTAFSRFNTGLTDRFKKEIKQSNEININVANQLRDLNKEKNLLYNKYDKTYTNYIEYLKRLSNFTYNDGEGDTYKDALTNFTTYLQQARQVLRNEIDLDRKSKGLSTDKPIPNFLPGTGFIPFNMSITMDGMSGMKIYSKFNIDTAYLPSNYPENAEFLIKNITHKIENNRWNTTLESIVTIKGKHTDATDKDIYPQGQTPTPPYTPRQDTLNTSAGTVYSFFRLKGFKDFQAAAWVGNLMQESNLNPNIVNSIGATGIAQWLNYTNPRTGATDPRKSRLLKKPNYNTLQVQLDYIWEELQTTENSAYKAIKATTSLESAVLAIRTKYERPGEKEAKDISRTKYAQEAFNKYA